MSSKGHSTKGNPKRAVGYIRVSTEEQHLGPEAQRSALERWAAAEGVDVVVWFVDHQSGGDAISKRLVLSEAITAVGSHEAGILLVAKRDRLARDSMNAAMLDAAVERQGGVVRSAAGEGTEGNDPTHILFRRMVDAFAEYERLIIAARTKAALAVLKRQQKRTGSLPLGFVEDEGGRIYERQEWAEARRIARQMREDGSPPRDIATMLSGRGLWPSRRAGKKQPLVAGEGSWSREQIRRFIDGV